MIVKHVDSRNRIPQIEYQVRYSEYEFFSFLLDSLVFHEDVLVESSAVVVQEWESMEESQWNLLEQSIHQIDIGMNTWVKEESKKVRSVFEVSLGMKQGRIFLL